jgi:beta-galactosidase
MQLNKSVKGKPLYLLNERGREYYDRGLGLHAHAEVTYDLGGKYKVFEASVGLDANTGRQGQVAVQILVDGRAHEDPKLKSITLAQGVVALRVDVTNAKTLVIQVLPGASGDAQSDLNFGNARLIR